MPPAGCRRASPPYPIASVGVAGWLPDPGRDVRAVHGTIGGLPARAHRAEKHSELIPIEDHSGIGEPACARPGSHQAAIRERRFPDAEAPSQRTLDAWRMGLRTGQYRMGGGQAENCGRECHEESHPRRERGSSKQRSGPHVKLDQSSALPTAWLRG